MGAGSGGFYVAQQMMKQATESARSTFKPDSSTHQLLFFAMACLVAVFLGWFGTLVGGFLIFIVFYVEIRALALVMPARWHARKWLLLIGAVLLAGVVYLGASAYLAARYPPHTKNYVRLIQEAKYDKDAALVQQLVAEYHSEPYAMNAMSKNGAASAVAFLVLFGSLAGVYRSLAWPVEARALG